MTSEIPSSAMVRLIAKVLGSRNTETNEVSTVIDTIYSAFGAREQAAQPEAAAPVEAPRKRRGRPPGSTNRARLRPAFAEPAPAVQSQPVAPSLLRRAEVVQPEPQTQAEIEPSKRSVRGVVKWYDGRNGKGSVRLPGTGDVSIDAGHLSRSGLSKLYPGQEVEAFVTGGGDAIERMTLIGGPQSERPLETGPIAVRRNTKVVMVEMKRDSLRRVAARAEAEQLLGSTPVR